MKLKENHYYTTKDRSLVYIEQNRKKYFHGKIIEAHPEKVSMVFVPMIWNKNGTCPENKRFNIIGEY